MHALVGSVACPATPALAAANPINFGSRLSGATRLFVVGVVLLLGGSPAALLLLVPSGLLCRSQRHPDHPLHTAPGAAAARVPAHPTVGHAACRSLPQMGGALR